MQAWKCLLRICASISLKTSLGARVPALFFHGISQSYYVHIYRLIQHPKALQPSKLVCMHDRQGLPCMLCTQHVQAELASPTSSDFAAA